ncbi:MAG: winged helix-turn-helix transcriptional regulator [Patescibacteria group bacterium]|nr:winged helix-turn-helix transcriptional regulator [Patescibacteria group bacterium]
MENLEKRNFHYYERIVRGFSNHRRIEILGLLAQSPQMSVLEIADALRINFKTASEHIRRLAIADLVSKRSDGTSIRHSLTPRGTSVLKFLRTLA